MSFKEYIKEDYQMNRRYNFKECLKKYIAREHEAVIWKYLIFLRKEEYFDEKGFKILSLLYRRRKNALGEKIGFTIHKGVFGKGLRIWHYGNIVVASQARVGKNCILHGNNCIGNKGIGSGALAPHIGDNVDIGCGAIILGGINIANNVTVAAGAVVIDSCEEENVILAGVPAHIIRKGKLLEKKKETYNHEQE